MTKTSDKNSSAGGNVPALEKAFAVLDLVSNSPNITFPEITKKLGFAKSTTFNLLKTMCNLGALQTTENNGYILGLKLSIWGTLATGQRSIERIAKPYLNALSREVGLTCHLGVLEGTEAIYLAKVEAEQHIQIATWVGRHLSLHSTSMGKVLLSFMTESERDNLIEHIEVVPKTPFTLTSKEALLKELEETRERGWALDDQEDILDIRCIAAPVFGPDGEVFAAISAVGTVLQLRTTDINSLADKVCSYAQKISLELGAASR